jgi:hypothetical protein
MLTLEEIRRKLAKNQRGNASQFLVAGELCRRGHPAVVTLGNTVNVDILCSNLAGTEFVHIQVKTFRRGASRCMVGIKAEKDFGPKFFWIITGLAPVDSDKKDEYFIIPSKIMSTNVRRHAKKYHETPNRNGELPKKTAIRIVAVPPRKNRLGWSIEKFRNKWDLIDEALR